MPFITIKKIDDAGEEPAAVVWRVPRGWHAERAWAEIRPMFAAWRILAVFSFSVAAAFAVKHLVERHFGPAPFDWVLWSAVAIAVGFVQYLIAAAAAMLAAPEVRITSAGVTIGDGPRGVVFRYRDIRKIRIRHERGLEILSLEVRDGRNLRERAFAIDLRSYGSVRGDRGNPVPYRDLKPRGRGYFAAGSK